MSVGSGRWLTLFGVVALLLATGAARAQQAAKAADEVAPKFRWGGDLRLREEHVSGLQQGLTGTNVYTRTRLRLWAEFDVLQDVTLRARVANETRYWIEPNIDGRPDVATYIWPDEWLFDNLYLDVRNLLDKKLDLRVGRQDFMVGSAPMFGNGRVLMDGTPEDGSRTFFFDAILATFRCNAENTVYAFGIYNDPDTDLAMNPQERELTGYTGSVDDMREIGAGVYLKNKTFKTVPMEAYAIWKQESEWEQAGAPSRAWQTAVSPTLTENPAADFGTVGARVAPQFSEAMAGSLEGAYQFGSRDEEQVTSYMLDTYLRYKLPVCQAFQPEAKAAFYYLSGDDPGSDKDEGWNPLWARWPQDSELYVFAYPRGRWSNLSMPSLGVSCAPLKDVKKLKLSATAAYMDAPEDDGPGDGTERGWLYKFLGEFTIGQGMLTAKDSLTGYLLIDILDPGDYYADTDSTAFFARWQINYAF